MQPSICPSSMDYRYLASIFIWHPMGIYWVSQEKKRANPELKAQNWAHLQLCLVGALIQVKLMALSFTFTYKFWCVGIG